MKKLLVWMLGVVAVGVIRSLWSWIFDRSGVLGMVVTQGSGSLVEQYQALPTDQPRSAKTSAIRDYMQAGVSSGLTHIVQAEQGVLSDFLWIRNIQQVGTFVLEKETPWLFWMIDNLTSLSPRWVYPYIFTQYMGPDQSKDGAKQAVRLGEDGIRMTCDPTLVQKIKTLSDTDFVAIVEKRGEAYQKLLRPCDDYRLPQMLAFTYFHYLNDLDKAIEYYKVASFDPDVPVLTPTMPALLRSKQWEHLISAQLWVDRALSMEKNIDDETIKTQYDRAINKAIMEIILDILGKTSDQTPDCKKDYSCLVQWGYLRQYIGTLISQCQSRKNVQCLLLQQWLVKKLIMPNGQLFDPFSDPRSDKWNFDTEWGRRTE